MNYRINDYKNGYFPDDHSDDAADALRYFLISSDYKEYKKHRKLFEIVLYVIVVLIAVAMITTILLYFTPLTRWVR